MIITSTTIISSIVVFLLVMLPLVSFLLFVKAKLAPSGKITIKINGEKEIEVDGGGTLLSTLSNEGIFLPSACGGGGTCIQCTCQVNVGGGEILPTEEPHFSRKEVTENYRLSCQVKVRENIEKVLFVIITSDRGMAGAFNTNVLKVAHKAIDDFGKENAQLICIGKKSATYFKSRGYNIVLDYIDFWNSLSFDIGLNVAQDIILRYMHMDVDKVQVIYNKFINVGRQEVCDEIFLPITPSAELIEDKNKLSDMIYEPSKKNVVEKMIPRYLNIIIWQYLLESNASEQAARMLAMENATSNADDMIKELTLQFNKARQTAITTEMLEIVSGAEALN